VKTSLTARCHLAWRGLASSTVNFTDSSATRTITTTCYELPASDMTYIVSGGAINSTQTKLRTTTHVALRQRGWLQIVVGRSISRDTIQANPTTLQLYTATWQRRREQSRASRADETHTDRRGPPTSLLSTSSVISDHPAARLPQRAAEILG